MKIANQHNLQHRLKCFSPSNLKFLGLLLLFSPLVFFTFAFFTILPKVFAAATTPSLGTAATFGILSSTFTRNVGLTTISGDLGYTTLSGSGTLSVTGTTHIADGAYSTAGTDQGSALTTLNAQSCDFSFGSPTDLSLLSQPLAPGVYCITAATSIGTGGITLNAGTYVFRISGAFTTVDNSIVTLNAGSSACDVFWTPTSATTLGANTTFKGTVIDDSGITVGNTTSWTGRALAFGGTVTTDTDTITVPTCTTPTPTPLPSSTPTPTPASSTTSSSSSTDTGGSSSCTSSGITTTPNIAEARRLSPTSIFIRWAANSSLNDFVIRYGFINGTWLFNTTVSGLSTTIGNLPANQSIWFQVASTDNCAIGSYSSPVLVGGTRATNSPGFPNTGNPRFPDTGIDPNTINIPWNVIIPISVFITVSASLIGVFIKRTDGILRL